MKRSKKSPPTGGDFLARNHACKDQSDAKQKKGDLNPVGQPVNEAVDNDQNRIEQNTCNQKAVHAAPHSLIL
jgi:hypothetical protein